LGPYYRIDLAKKGGTFRVLLTINPAGFNAGLISGAGMRRRKPQLAQAPEMLGNSHIFAGISGATIKSVRTTDLIAGLIGNWICWVRGHLT